MTTSRGQSIGEKASPLLSRSQKAFLITVLIYAIAVGVVILSLHKTTTPRHNASQLREVPLSTKMFSAAPPTPKTVPETQTKPKPKVKPNVKPQIKPNEIPVKKVVPPVKPKPKPMIKKKPIPKHESKKVIKKVVKPKITPPPVVKSAPAPKEVVEKSVSTPITQPIMKSQSRPTPVKKTPATHSPPQPTTEQRAAQANAEKSYLNALQNALSRYAQNTYPFMAKRRHWAGNVEVTFTLHRDGSITDVHVTTPDMRDVFNEAAISIFTGEMQLNFKPFPKEIKKNTWTLTVPISYDLQ